MPRACENSPFGCDGEVGDKAKSTKCPKCQGHDRRHDDKPAHLVREWDSKVNFWARRHHAYVMHRFREKEPQRSNIITMQRKRA